jgi:hypothetical protein
LATESSPAAVMTDVVLAGLTACCQKEETGASLSKEVRKGIPGLTTQLVRLVRRGCTFGLIKRQKLYVGSYYYDNASFP